MTTPSATVAMRTLKDSKLMIRCTTPATERDSSEGGGASGAAALVAAGCGASVTTGPFSTAT
jgi:hypothetical protein